MKRNTSEGNDDTSYPLSVSIYVINSLYQYLLVGLATVALLVLLQRVLNIGRQQFPIMVNEEGHHELDLGLERHQIGRIQPRPRQHGLIIINPPQQHHQIPILTLLLNLIEIRYDVLLDVLLVLFLEDLHDGELLDETRCHVIADLDQVGHGEFGALDDVDELVVAREVLHELRVD